MSAVFASSEIRIASGTHGGDHYEIINGETVELPPMGAYQSALASFLCGILEPFTRLNHLGRIVVETLFHLAPEGKLQRKPDVAFISYQRWPMNRRIPNSNARDVVPELAIEVNSPFNTADEVLLKIRDYFRAGVKSVWIVYDCVELVYVYSSPTSCVILTRGQTLEDESLLPGFRLPLAELFQTGSEDPAPLNVAASPS